MTKLEGVNKLMRKAGLQPVRALDTDGASNAAEAERCLDDAELEIQSRGWNYNTRTNIELEPDGSGNITVPAGIISINPMVSGDTPFSIGLQYGATQAEGSRITTQGEHLYDLANNTDVFTSSVWVTYIQRWEFHCIPFQIQDYIVCLGASRFNEKRGTERLQPSINRDVDRARRLALQANNNQSAVNILGTAQMTQFTGVTSPRTTP